MVAPSNPERHLVWHPRGQPSFLLAASSQLTLYDFSPRTQRITHRTSLADLPFMKCVAWSPDPHFDDLVAVGQTNGRVDLMRVGASQESQAGFGGSAERRTWEEGTTLSPGTVVSLPIRNSRAVNALAFSAADPNYLAAGLDKVRGDPSLLIWDVASSVPSLSFGIGGGDGAATLYGRPMLGGSGRLPLTRMDPLPRTDSRVIQAHAPTEVISALAFLPHTPHLLLAALSSRWLRLFDLRAPSIPTTSPTSIQQPTSPSMSSHSPTAQFQTPNIGGQATLANTATKAHLVATSVLDANLIASAGDGVVSVWDSRRLATPLLTFNSSDGSGGGGRGVVAKIEWSGARRGVLGVMERDGAYVKFWDVASAGGGDGTVLGGSNVNANILANAPGIGGHDGRGRANTTGGRAPSITKRSWWARQNTSEDSYDQIAKVVLSNSRRSRRSPKPLTSFALLPPSAFPPSALDTTPPSSDPDALFPSAHPSSYLLVSTKDALSIMPLHDAPLTPAWSSRGGLVCAAGGGVKIVGGGGQVPEAAEHPHNVSSNATPNNNADGRGRAGSVVEHRDPSRSPRPGAGATNGDGRANGNASTLAPSPPALFGRGDADGFPALVSPIASPGRSHSQLPLPSVSAHQGRSRTSTPPPTRKKGRDTAFSPSALARLSLSPGQEYRAGKGGRDERSPLQPHVRLPPDVERKEPRVRRGDGSERRRSKSRGRSRARSRERSAKAVVEGDISLLMRRRARNGYGLEHAEHNARLAREDDDHELADLWDWIHHANDILGNPTSRVGGYEFAHQGILGIWEGFAPILPRVNPPLAPPPSNQPHTPAPPEPPHPSPAHHPSAGSGGSGGSGGMLGKTASMLHLSSAISATRSIVPSFTGSMTAPNSPTSSPPRSTATLQTDTATDQSGGSELDADEQPPAEYDDAVDMVLMQSAGLTAWKPMARTEMLARRRLALKLSGWDEAGSVGELVEIWQGEGQWSRAACWLLFMQQHDKALSALMQSDDETHIMLSGTIAALINQSSSSNGKSSAALKGHAQQLARKLHDPYFRTMLTWLTTKDFTTILDAQEKDDTGDGHGECLPLVERLAIALHFLPDDKLAPYLRKVVQRASLTGDINALVISGLIHAPSSRTPTPSPTASTQPHDAPAAAMTTTCLDILQVFVDRTGDVQTAASLAAHLSYPTSPANGAERWVEAYRDLLDGFRMFHERVWFDVERGRVLRERGAEGSEGVWEGRRGARWAPSQVLIRCNYCNKPMGGEGFKAGAGKGRPTACPNCSRSLPRCSICLMTLSIVPDNVRDADLSHSQADYRDTIDEALVICQSCRHGGHASHILDWFFGAEGIRARGVCPVVDCDCRYNLSANTVVPEKSLLGNTNMTINGKFGAVH
ncbi:hypothetical protein CONPUDRAFT_71947 [Coniophora puteana RWD-64-598 SS2]|uniref:Uncharacterized protein n=1 Tax=Coniophora puteana (strain RWD-64-598) TaxID=741705 RepID=A0A5M3MW49_CONPW|nr:uncharacterized protein CONPUDRAFT_71947 [Coniophora puteana RWD-64-598 SS2]EIW83392.1 hypothetical protein CONPUDRAFT_71947 [Coniophora puteana RWD-64-598 SS2]